MSENKNKVDEFFDEYSKILSVKQDSPEELKERSEYLLAQIASRSNKNKQKNKYLLGNIKNKYIYITAIAASLIIFFGIYLGYKVYFSDYSNENTILYTLNIADDFRAFSEDAYINNINSIGLRTQIIDSIAIILKNNNINFSLDGNVFHSEILINKKSEKFDIKLEFELNKITIITSSENIINNQIYINKISNQINGTIQEILF